MTKKLLDLLDLTKERFYQFSFDDTIRKAHSQGLDHKFLLDEGEKVTVGREDSNEALTVSSGEDEALSD